MNEGYLKRSWDALRADQGWWRYLVVLALVQLIPIIGQMVFFGYVFRWAREAAWGMRTSFRPKVDDLGKALRSGAKVYVVGLLGGLIIGAVMSIVSSVPRVGMTISIVIIPLYLAASMILIVISMRCVLYDSLEPLVQIPQAFQMARYDPLGLIRLCGIFCLSLIPLLLCEPLILGLFGLTAFFAPGHTLGTLLFGMTALILIYLCLLVTSVLDALAVYATGLWTMRFRPATWGPSKAGIPPAAGACGPAGDPFAAGASGPGSPVGP